MNLYPLPLKSLRLGRLSSEGLSQLPKLIVSLIKPGAKGPSEPSWLWAPGLTLATLDAPGTGRGIPLSLMHSFNIC